MRKTKILILESQRMIREMWMQILGERSEWKVIGASDKLREVLRLARDKTPDIVLVDIQPSGKLDYQSIRRILKISPSTAVIATSYYTDELIAGRMIKLGASGYITKNSALAELFKVISQVTNGETYISSEIAQTAGGKIMRRRLKGPDLHLLTDREREVITLLIKGYSSLEIAEDLGMSSKTAEVHRHNIFRKLNITSRLELFKLFMILK